MDTKQPLWSLATSRNISKAIIGAIALAIVWAGLWMYGSWVAVGSPTIGFITGFPLWVIGSVGFLAVIFAKPKANK